MASGDLVTSAISYVDSNEPVAIAAAIDALTLAAATDVLYVIPVAQQNKFAIFSVTRAA